MSRSSSKATRRRERRKAGSAGLVSRHRMWTRSNPISLVSVGAVRLQGSDGVGWDLDAKFAMVIEESITRGVNLGEPNPAYGKDGGWCVKDEVTKVLVRGVALGI